MYHLTYPSRQPDQSDVRWAGADAIRALGRICWTRRSKLVERDGGDWWTCLEGMESRTSPPPSTLRRMLILGGQDVKQMQPEEAMKLGNQTQHLAHYLSASDPLQPDSDTSLLEPADMQTYGFNSVAQVMHLCSAMKVNAFTLTSPSLTPIGISISPLLALANHSCAPNAVAVFPRGGREIDLVAISDIAPGSETSPRRTTSANPSCSTATVSPATVPYASSPNAEKEKGGMKNGWTLGGVSGTLAITSTGKVGSKCNSCGETFEVCNDALKALIQQGYELLEKEENGTLAPSPALQTLSTLLPPLLALSPPSSHPLLALLHLSALLLSPQTTLPGSLALGVATHHLALASSASFLALPPNHPSTAVTLAKWGKLLSLDLEGPSGAGAEMPANRLQTATTVLKQALSAAELGFGAEGGVVGLEMAGLVKGSITSTGKVGSKCNSCGAKFDVYNDELKALIQQGYELLEKEENGTLAPSPALQTLSTLLPPLLSLSPPSSHPLLALLHLSALLLSPQKSPQKSPGTLGLEMATHHLALASSASFLALPPNHPSTAVTLAKWGKLLSLDLEGPKGPEGAEMPANRLQTTTTVLRQALSAAELGFGAEGGVVGLEMAGLVKGCEGELGVYRAKKRGLV
ncbi:hypothetical protein B9479_006745 [Cryptococcus floricola]|uniref:Uncharacterized protein n=1 Tax=Cryptococcus floricola TaxID=2591691 RepID=A0A5D3AR93_9TREE|nr:hypothetical protein B9479_006745 [Cryptococcus floricola]